jgi:hypothetical protein
MFMTVEFEQDNKKVKMISDWLPSFVFYCYTLLLGCLGESLTNVEAAFKEWSFFNILFHQTDCPEGKAGKFV